MQVGTGVGGWPSQVGAAAKRAEETGFDRVSCGELSHDSIVTMTVAATATRSIGLQTSVTIAFPRSPMVLAMQAWDLQQLSGGRFEIGLGSQVKGHNERRFGGTWTPPAPRMREYVQMMHGIWDSWQNGAPAKFEGEHYRYTLMTPAFNPGPIDFDRPKVAVAMVGPGMARTAGQVSDVVMPHGGIMSDRYMREVLLPAVRKGLVDYQRSWSDVEISASGYLVMGDDHSEIEQKLLAMRQPLSFYGSTRTYHKVLSLHGLDDLGHELHALSLQGKWDEMRETVKLDHLRELAQTCTYDEYPDFVTRHREYANRTGFAMPMSTPEQRERFAELLKRVQAAQTTGVPRGLEIDPA